MTHSYQTSQLNTRSRYTASKNIYRVEVEDFDNEIYYFDDIEASSYSEASDIVSSLCSDIDIYNMNIYQF